MTDIWEIYGLRNGEWHYFNTHRGDEEGAKVLAQKLIEVTSYQGVRWEKQ